MLEKKLRKINLPYTVQSLLGHFYYYHADIVDDDVTAKRNAIISICLHFQYTPI